MIKCEFEGCEERRQRKDIPAHNQEYLVQHMQLLLQMVQKLQAEQQEKSEKEQQRREELQARHLPTTVTVPNIEQQLATKNKWKSPLLYTHERGYAIQLAVYVGGYGIAGLVDDISVYVHIIRGKYDNELAWPCRFNIQVPLINHEQDGENVTRIANFRASKNTQHCNEGWLNFIKERNARQQFIKDDCLQFRVSKIN